MNEYSFPVRDGSMLRVQVFSPIPQGGGKGKYPAIVFWFGGGWMNGTTEQFFHQAQSFAENGFVAFIPEYRTYKDGYNFLTDMQDAFDFLQYLDANAEQFSVDREGVFLSGGSAGGYLAVSTVMFSQLQNKLKICGLVLFNPVLDTSVHGYQSRALLEQPWNPIIFSPLHFLYATQSEPMVLPPMLIFHGTDDTTMPFPRIKLFEEEAERQNMKVRLCAYSGQEHGFFNYRDGKNPYFEDTLKKALDFCGEVLKKA